MQEISYPNTMMVNYIHKIPNNYFMLHNIRGRRIETLYISKATVSSAVAEHVAKTNHVTGWDEAKLIAKESHRKTRDLSNIYGQLISIPPSTFGSKQYKKAESRGQSV